MARPPKPAAPNNDHLIDNDAFDQAVTDANEMAVIDQELQANALAIAEQLGYTNGVISVDRIEDEIKLYQRRTAECVLELGKRLLILKELTPFGEFEQRIELLGFHVRSAQRFMTAALKFSKSDNLSLLSQKIDSQSKLLELVTLDDSDLEQLANGESIRGIKLDDIETMTASQLKAALKESRENEVAKGKILSDKNTLIDNLNTKLLQTERRVQTLPPDEIAQKLQAELMGFAFEAEHVIANKLGPGIQELLLHSDTYGGDCTRYIHGLLREVELKCAMLRELYPQIDSPDQVIDLEDDSLTSQFAVNVNQAQPGEPSAADLLNS